MNDSKSFSELWSAQSNATRIATSIAFAMAIGFLLYGFVNNLVGLHAWLYATFETRSHGFNVLSATAMVVIIVTQLILAVCCARAQTKLKNGGDVRNFASVGLSVVLTSIVVLGILGGGIALLLMEMPKAPTTLDFTPLFMLLVLNLVIMVFTMGFGGYMFTDDADELPEDAVSLYGALVSLLSLAFLIPGFSVLTLVLWVAGVALTLMLRPVSINMEKELVTQDNLRRRAEYLGKTVPEVISLGI